MADIGALDKALAAIDDDPAAHDQGQWRCQTGMCLAGFVAQQDDVPWAVEYRAAAPVLVVPPVPEFNKFELQAYVIAPELAAEMLAELPDGQMIHRDTHSWREPLEAGLVHVADYAWHRLGLNSQQADCLFHGDNTRKELQAMRDVLAERPDAPWEDLRDVRVAAAGPDAEDVPW